MKTKIKVIYKIKQTNKNKNLKMQIPSFNDLKIKF